MKTCIILHTALLLVACSSVTPSKTSPKQNDGRPWVPLSCSGILQWDTCFNEAKALCPNGYDIANKIELRPSQTRKMEVACKG